MTNLNALIELGGWSMVGILTASVIALMVVIVKFTQYSMRGFWAKSDVTHKDLMEARSGLKLLEIIANVAPLLGLLGTVLGMIEAFRTLAESGQAPEITLLAGGIWQALSTTAAGMIVAIIASVFLGLFDGVVERMALQLERNT